MGRMCDKSMFRRLIIIVLTTASSALLFACAYCVVLGVGLNWTVLDNHERKILFSMGTPGSSWMPSLRLIATRFTGTQLPPSQAAIWSKMDWAGKSNSVFADKLDSRQIKQLQQLFSTMGSSAQPLAIGPVSIICTSLPSVATYEVSDSSFQCWYILPANGNRLDVTRATLDAWLLIIILAAYPTIAFIRGPLRRRRRRKRGLCLSCGYNLTGNTTGVCPECSQKIEGDSAGRGERA